MNRTAGTHITQIFAGELTVGHRLINENVPGWMLDASGSVNEIAKVERVAGQNGNAGSVRVYFVNATETTYQDDATVRVTRESDEYVNDPNGFYGK